MAKGKQISSKNVTFVQGGKGHMLGKKHAGTQTPGALVATPRSNNKFAGGGSGHMVGKTGVRAAKAK